MDMSRKSDNLLRTHVILAIQRRAADQVSSEHIFGREIGSRSTNEQPIEKPLVNSPDPPQRYYRLTAIISERFRKKGERVARAYAGPSRWAPGTELQLQASTAAVLYAAGARTAREFFYHYHHSYNSPHHDDLVSIPSFGFAMGFLM